MTLMAEMSVKATIFGECGEKQVLGGLLKNKIPQSGHFEGNCNLELVTLLLHKQISTVTC